MNNKKELIKSSIENIRTKLDNENSIIKKRNSDINDEFRDFIINNFGMSSENIKRVNVSVSSTVIYVIGKNSDYTSELTIYHKGDYKENYGIGYFSTIVDEESENILIYLELVGKVANDFRKEKKIINKLDLITESIIENEREYKNLLSKLYKLENELYNIINDEMFNKAINNGGVKLPEPIRTEIRPSDKYKAFVSEFEVINHTNKTITIKYIDSDGHEIDTYRQSYVDGKNELIKFQFILEEMIDSETVTE